jgi:hypothetical protein
VSEIPELSAPPLDGSTAPVALPTEPDVPRIIAPDDAAVPPVVNDTGLSLVEAERLAARLSGQGN